MKLIKAALLCISILCFTSLNAGDFRLDSPSSRIEVSKEDAKQPLYLPLTIVIPDKSYIYSNPKGPGTGKPLEITLFHNDKLIEKTIFIEQAEKYTSLLETELDQNSKKKWIWRHTGEVQLLIRIDDLAQEASSLKVVAKALLCDENTCTPVKQSLIVSFEQNNTDSQFLIRDESVLDSYHSFSSNTNQKSQVTNDSLRKLERRLTPRFINKESVNGLFMAIVMGLAAGIILNVMPCVLPVISLKIMTLVKHSENRRSLFINGLLYALGVMLTFVLLATLAAFAGHGWGSLFQNRNFIIVMTVIIYSLALSMLGVYTLSTPAFLHKVTSGKVTKGYLSSFVNGLLATLLATPCSGPFLGATLTWTLTQPAIIIYAVFISIGLGLSLPFVVLSLFPKLVSKIPRGGNWTLYMERVFGFLLIISVLYFLTLLNQSYLLFTIVLLWFVSVGLWQLGIFAAPIKKPYTRYISYAILLLFITAGVITSKSLFLPDKQATQMNQELYSHARLRNQLDIGNITVVKFTADWCPNCKLVEVTAIKSQKVQDFVAQHKITFLKGDITAENTESEELLHSLGSQSIPYLAVFVPGENENSPLCLRDIYSADELLHVLEEAVKEKEATQPRKIEQQIESITF